MLYFGRSVVINHPRRALPRCEALWPGLRRGLSASRFNPSYSSFVVRNFSTAKNASAQQEPGQSGGAAKPMPRYFPNAKVEDDEKDDSERRPPVDLNPLKYFLVGSAVVFGVSFFPLLGDSMAGGGLMLCQTATEPHYVISGLQRLRFTIRTEHTCKLMFTPPKLFQDTMIADVERIKPTLAQILRRNVVSSNQSVQAETLGLLEHVLAVWPGCSEKLREVDLQTALRGLKAAKRQGGEKSSEEQIDRILQLLEPKNST